VPTTRTLTAGAGLTGGGDLSTNRTFTVGAGNGITVNADDVALTTPGTLTSATTNSSSGNHTHVITNYALSGTASQVTVTGAGKVLGATTALSLPDPINVSTSGNAATATKAVTYENDATLVDGTVAGQVTIVVATGALAFAETAKIQLASISTTFNMVAGDTITLVWTGSLWLETSRSFAF
jgi:hypothetical protein